MFTLDYFYNTPPKFFAFNSRKITLPKGSFNLYGARGTGKSALILNYISKLPQDSYIYIDAQDPIFVWEDIDIVQLEIFLKENKINILVIDHYFEGFLDYLPNIEQIIVVSRERLNMEIESIKLYPLDFEEFFNFQKTISTSQNFSLYTKLGSLPKIAKTHNPFSYKELFFEKFDIQEEKVLLILSLFHTKVATPHQIYQKAKEYFKISKDWLYSAIKKFTNEGVIYQIDTKEKGFGKKMYLYDFALAKYLNKSLNFNSIFDSIVALALIKHDIEFKAYATKPYYLTKNNELIVISPLTDEDSFWSKSQREFSFYSNLKPNRVTIITNSNSYNFKIGEIEFAAIPFYEWATGLK